MVIKKLVVIIGGGWSGVGVAGSLSHYNIDDYLLLEQNDCFGGFWKNHTYDSVRMHDLSRLYKTPSSILEKYKNKCLNRMEVISYLHEYAEHYGVQNHTLWNFKATNVLNNGEEFAWVIKGIDSSGNQQTIACKYLCIATSYCRLPFIPNILKDSMNQFQGPIIHSYAYKNPSTFSNLNGKRILIIGGGHSASEIATELADSGFQVTISYRSGQYFMKQEDWTSYLLNQTLEKSLEYFKYSMNDKEFTNLLENYNQQFSSKILDINDSISWIKPSLPPASFLVLHKKTFIDDQHFFDLLLSGKIKMTRDVLQITKNGVLFSNNETGEYDGIVLCTGFRPGLEEFLEDAEKYLSSHRFPSLPPEKFPLPQTDGRCKSLTTANLYFPGFDYGINQRVDFGVYAWYVGERIAKETNSNIVTELLCD